MISGILLTGEGYFTTAKVMIGNLAIFLIVAACILYTALNILMIVLWVLKINGKDYIEEW